MTTASKDNQSKIIWLGVLLLLVATFTRLFMLDTAPPGLQHDEIFKAQEGVALIEQGDFRLFYPTNQGHEGAFVWLLGISYALVGQNLLMIKFAAFVCGLLTVALTYRVFGRLYNWRIGFISAGLLAVSFWGIFTSRVGLRAVTLPLVALLVIAGLHYLYRTRPATQSRWIVSAFTGFTLGLSIYTYTSSFALFVAFTVYVIFLALFKRDIFRKTWRELILVGLLAGLIALPMIYIRLDDPQGQNRVSTITRPLNDALNGQPQELIDNAFNLAGMFYFTGDPEWRYNVADRPVFDTIVGLLVYVGLAVMLWKIRKQPLNIFILTMAFVGLVPSLFTVSAPSFLRSILMMPVAMLFIALVLDLFTNKRLVWTLGVLTISVTAISDGYAYFVDWQQNAEVHTIYRDDIEQLAEFLRQQPTNTKALISTENVNLDPKILPYYQPPDDTQITFFDGQTNIVLSDIDNTLLFISPQSAITPPHADWLTSENGTVQLEPVLNQDGEIAYNVYKLDNIDTTLRERLTDVQTSPIYHYDTIPYGRGDVSEWAEPLDYPVNFGGLIELVGVELPRKEIASQRDGVNIQLYLRPLVDDVDLPLNVFVHMSRRSGEVHAQRDLLGVPTVQWQKDSIIIQDNFVIAGDSQTGNYMITMGIYNFVTGERIPIIDTSGNTIADQVIVDRIRVVEATE